MVFLIPLLVIIAIVFGLDYIYFKDQDKLIQIDKKEQDFNSSLEEQRKQYIKDLFKTK
ncbi:hypothetical protein LNU06_02925 [Campylobacter sp. VicNov18]|uniref:hypothetical protein n=1 Tax=Campylobacter bilis TaxID=2691918 RepID=UPI00187BAA39|nr:hypothetical protein [Campylobacter bilis]MCC8277743.1 hypothetical protein [Campylobacter bilis]MCC8299352.1 hypothetical protein [Campylobacter bilis]MCC8300652.1 hypothetical protein [Campylobacter bilis]MCC8349750.1 hypothetical protein [Campylobacter bilis]MCC8355462.1 hypothetical protein [Campylobacter bilis]